MKNKKRSKSSRKKTAALIPAFDYTRNLRVFKRKLVAKALVRCKGNKSRAAKLLGISRPYLYQLLDEI